MADSSFRTRRTIPGEILPVAGFHLIWTAYGWWLPNDPRGSSSHEIPSHRSAGRRNEGKEDSANHKEHKGHKENSFAL